MVLTAEYRIVTNGGYFRFSPDVMDDDEAGFFREQPFVFRTSICTTNDLRCLDFGIFLRNDNSAIRPCTLSSMHRVVDT